MKKIVILLLTLCSVFAYGQQTNTTNTSFTNGLGATKFFNIPSGTTPPTTGVLVGSLFYKTSVGLQYWDGATWQTLGTATGSVPTSRTLTINGVTYDLSANRTWNVGTVTSVAALTLGTSGTDLTSSVATGSTTPVITLNVPTASASNRGALSAADWTTFNNKAGAGATFTLGSTSIALGSTTTSVTGMTSLSSTSFTGALTGHASLDLPLTAGNTAPLTGDLFMVKAAPYFIADGSSVNNGAGFQALGWNTTNKNWQMSTGLSGGGLDFIPSTIIGGNIFITPAVHFTEAGGITGSTLTASSIAALGTAATTYVTQTGGLLQTRTTSEVLSDIGAQASYPGLQDSLTKKANKTFDNVASGAIANAKLANSTISGVALGSNLAALTFGYGLSATGTYTGATARAPLVDTASIATKALLSTYLTQLAASTGYIQNQNAGAQTSSNLWLSGTAKAASFATLNSTFTTTLTGQATANRTWKFQNASGTLADSATVAGKAATNQTMFIGTTSTAINRSSGTQNLAGIGTLGVGAITSSGTFTSSVGNSTQPFTASGATTGYQFASIVSNGAGVYWGIEAATAAGVFTGTTNNSSYIGNVANTDFHIATNGTVRQTISGAGAVTFTGNITAPTIKLTSGAANGYVLKSDASGNASWQSSAGGTTYKGSWNANTNTPTLADGTGTTGDMYAVSVGGTQFSRTFVAGGWAIYNGSIWEAVGTSANVTSVNSLTGAVQINPSISGDVISVTGGTATADISGATSIANKLPLAGGTLTGGLTGTTANFTTSVTSPIHYISDATLSQSGSFFDFDVVNGKTLRLNNSGNGVTIGGTLALGANNMTLTGSIAATGARVTKGWFTDIESTNMPTVGGTSLSSTFAGIAQTMYIGTTAHALNRASASEALTGITSIDGSAAKWTTARNLAGNSVDGSANVAFANNFIVQGTSDAGLSGAQFMGALGTGIVKNTTSTGVLSIAVAGDFPTLNQNTTGSAATLTTSRNIWGQAFNGSTSISGAMTGVTTIASSGTQTTTVGNSGTILTGSAATTGYLLAGALASSNASLNWGFEANSAAGLYTGSQNNAGFIGTSTNSPFQLVANGAAGLSLAATGAIKFDAYSAGVLNSDASGNLTASTALPSGTTATTQSASDNSTKVATTAYVDAADVLKANLASPTFTGTPSMPTGTTGVTQTASDNSTKLATTAYVDNAVSTVPVTSSGTYTPTYANVSGASSITATTVHYMQIADQVHVQGRVQVTPTSSSGSVTFTMTLPPGLGSTFVVVDDVNGFGSCPSAVGKDVGVGPDILPSTKSAIYFTTTSTDPRWIDFDFTYTINSL